MRFRDEMMNLSRPGEGEGDLAKYDMLVVEPCGFYTTQEKLAAQHSVSGYSNKIHANSTSKNYTFRSYSVQNLPWREPLGLSV